MRLDRTPLTVLLLLAALAAAQMLHYHPLLPDSIAVHFGASGEPNGWSGKTEFVMTYGATEALVVLLGIGLALTLSRIPASLVNIPHRQHWLAPERRDDTVVFLSTQIVWMEAVTLGFLMAIAQLVFTKNLGDTPPRLSGDFWYLLVAFVGTMLWFVLRIVLRFRKRG